MRRTKTIHNFSELLSRPAIYGNEDMGVNGDQPQTMDEPVIMPTDLDDKSKEVVCGRMRVMNRFRRCAGKRSRSMCCVCIPGDDSSCQKDACRVDDIERLSGPDIHGSEDVNVNGDQPQTMDVPLIMSTDLDDKSTKVVCGRMRVMKRFRRWAGKRLRSMCCVCIPRDDSTGQKDACKVDDIGNNGKESLNNSPAINTKNGYETMINGLSDPLIITNESITILNSVYSAQDLPENQEIVFKSNENGNNADSLCENTPKMPESNSPHENEEKWDERISVNTAESLISDTDKCDSIVISTKSTTSLQTDNATPDKIVSIVTTASQSIRDEHYSINSINHENSSEINDIKSSHENIQHEDEKNSANDADHSISEKYEHTQLQTKPMESRKLDTDYERDFVFRTNAVNRIIRKQNPIAMPSYENLPCSQERNLQRSDNQARSERSSINAAKSRSFEEYEHSHPQMKSTASRNLDIDSKHDFVFKPKSANHILRKQQDPTTVPLYNVRSCLEERNLQRDRKQTEDKQNSVNNSGPRIHKKQKRNHLETLLMMSRKSDVDSKGNVVPISAVAKYHYTEQQESITMSRYKNVTGSQERKSRRDNEQTGDEQSSVNKAELRICENHDRSHPQTTPTTSRKANGNGKLVSIYMATLYHFPNQGSATMSQYENDTGLQERQFEFEKKRRVERDNKQTEDKQRSVKKAKPRNDKKQKRNHLETLLMMSRKSDVDSKGNVVPISAVAKYHYTEQQEAITTPRYENITESQERKSQCDSEQQMRNEQSSANKAERRIGKKQKRSHL